MIHHQTALKTLGVTGGIGSGKSTVCRMLEKLGARIFYADVEGKSILVTDPEARIEIEEAFGQESYKKDGQLNREYLAQSVFSNTKHLRRINDIVHPRVYAAFERAKQSAESDGIALLVNEAALIYESGGDRYLDAIAVVDAPLDDRIRRVTLRDQVSDEQILSRMSFQLPTEELLRRADYVIRNNGSVGDLQKKVEVVYASIIGHNY